MTKHFASVFFLTGVLLAAGCARERGQTKAPNPHTTGFSQAGVSLVLGEEWQSSNLASQHSLQPPTLTSQAGVIRVMLLPPDRSEPELVADVKQEVLL